MSLLIYLAFASLWVYGSSAACLVLQNETLINTTRVSDGGCEFVAVHGRLVPPVPAFSVGDVAAALARGKAAGNISIVAFGGSVTAGHHASTSFGEILAAWLQHRMSVPVAFQNEGIGGAGASFPSVCTLSMLGGTQPTIVLVEFSVNIDVPWSIRRLVEAMENHPARPVVLYVDTFSQLTFRAGFAAWEVNTSMPLPSHLGNWDSMAYSELRLPCFSLGRAFVGASDELRGVLLKSFAADRHHLTNLGHAVFAEMLAAYLDPVIERLAAGPAPQPAPPPAGSVLPGECYTVHNHDHVHNTPEPVRLWSTAQWEFGAVHGFDKRGWHIARADASAVDAFVLFQVYASEEFDTVGVGAHATPTSRLASHIRLQAQTSTVCRTSMAWWLYP